MEQPPGDNAWLQSSDVRAGHPGLTRRQVRDLLAVMIMVIGATLVLGALAAVDVRLAVGAGGVLFLAGGALLAVERTPEG